MTNLGWCRKNINRQIGRINQLFKWGLENELIPASDHHALSAVAGLRAGRSDARESRPVKPVPVERITALRPYLSRQVAAMIDLQLLIGMRPGEVISMRGADVETRQEGVTRYGRFIRLGRDPRVSEIPADESVNRATSAPAAP